MLEMLRRWWRRWRKARKRNKSRRGNWRPTDWDSINRYGDPSE
jgi:hypothetical protein